MTFTSVTKRSRSVWNWLLGATSALAIVLAGGWAGSLHAQEGWEWEAGEGYHEEEWYDPSDWFDDDSTVDYEYDWGGAYDYGYDDYEYDEYGNGYDAFDEDEVYTGYQSQDFGNGVFDDYDYDSDWYYTDDWYDDAGDFDEWY